MTEAALDPALARVLDAAASVGGRHSPLYAWLWAHRAALRKAFSEKPPNWREVAAAIHEIDLRDADGNLPNVRTIQQTWRRVLRRAGEQSAARPATARPSEAVQFLDSTDGGRRDRPRETVTLRPSVPRSEAQAAPAVAAPAPDWASANRPRPQRPID